MGPIMATFRTADFFALYVEMTTDLGRRQLKFSPTDLLFPTRQFGYRYSVGLGRTTRNGELQTVTLDLVALSTAAEPDIRILSIDSVFARVKDSLDIELIDPSTTALPPSPQTPSEVTPLEAARFLTQATYGPTQTSIQNLVALGSYDAWIDQQFAAPVSKTLPYVKATSNGSLSTTRHHVWFDNVINGADQVRQRVALAWSELFVISDRDYVLSNSQYGVSQYYDLLAEQGLGNFRTLLETVTLHPTMGVFLSMIGNEKADPARNVLSLIHI